jgi:hypothetical protein
MTGLVRRTGGAGGHSPGSSVGVRDSNRLVVVLVEVKVLRESRRSAIPSTLFHLIPTLSRRQAPDPVSGPNQARRAGWRRSHSASSIAV